MIIKNGKTTSAARKPSPITAGTTITSSVQTRQSRKPASAAFQALTPAQQQFARTLRSNMTGTRGSVMAATNTSNIMARPEFMELLPMFVQKLLILDVFG